VTSSFAVLEAVIQRKSM